VLLVLLKNIDFSHHVYQRSHRQGQHMETSMNGWYGLFRSRLYHAPSTVLRNVYWVLVAGRTMHNID